MRAWETLRIFLALATLMTGFAILGYGPILELIEESEKADEPNIDISRLTVPAPDPDVLAFPKLVRNRDWPALERMDRWAIETFEDTSPEMAEHLDAWVAARPKSAKARMARGMYWKSVGWATRGGQSARDTHRWQFGWMYGAFGKAIADFKAVARMARDWAAPHAMLVEIHMAEGDHLSMELAFHAGVAADPADPSPYRYRLHAASPWWSADGRQDARATRKRILDDLGPVESRPERLWYLDGYAPLLEAEIARRANQDKAAERHFREAHGYGPFFTWKYADFLRRQGRHARAAPLFIEAIEGRPFGAGKYADYARTLRRLDALDLAREAIEISLAISPYNRFSNREAGYLAQTQGRHQDALAYFERALFYGRYVGLYWAALGDHRLNHLGDPRQAAKDYATAAKLEPDRPRYLYLHARALDKALDCMTVPAYRAYLAKCEQGGACKPEYVDWADFAWRDLVDRRLCEESGDAVIR